MTLTSSSLEESKIRDNLLFEAIHVKQKALWKKIAKNEILLKTYRFKNHRNLFFIFLYSFLFTWTFFLCPLMMDSLLPKAEVQANALFRPIVAMIIEYMMMIFFFIILMYPLNIVYRKAEIGFKEILISSPVKAGDIFIGEFLGKLPIYSIFILMFGPILIGLFNPLINFTFIQFIIIYVSLFGMVILSTLIGSIIASFLEHKIAKSEKARDFGKSIIMIIAIVMVVIMYSMQFLFNYLIENPESKNWFMFYPSFWFSNIILFTIDSALIDQYLLNIWSSSILAIGALVLLLYVSLKKADSFYTLEGGIEKLSSQIIKENRFYRLIKKLTGYKWGGLTVIHLKNYFRKKENTIKLVYIGGVASLMALMILFASEEQWFNEMMSVWIIITVGMMFSLMIGSYIFVDSKDILWVFKRSPRGTKGIVYSYIIALFIINILIIIPISIIHGIILEFDVIKGIIHALLLFIFCSLAIIEAVGIQCMNPSFEEKGRTMAGNIASGFIIHFSIVIAIMVLLIELNLFEGINKGFIKLIFLGPIILIHTLIALPLFYFGMRRLGKLE